MHADAVRQLGCESTGNRRAVLLAGRGRLIQRSLTSFYVALGIFVATTIGIGVAALWPRVAWLPTTMGAGGTVVLFYGCVMLIGEAREQSHAPLEVPEMRRDLLRSRRLRDRFGKCGARGTLRRSDRSGIA